MASPSPSKGRSPSPNPLNLPNFPAIHKKWDEQFQKGMDLCRKHNTSIHQFHFYTDNRVKNRCTICLEAEEGDECDLDRVDFKTPQGLAVPRKSGKSSSLKTGPLSSGGGSGNLRLLRKNTPIVPRSYSRGGWNTDETPLKIGNLMDVDEEDMPASEMDVAVSDDTTLANMSVFKELQNINPNDTMALEDGIKVSQRARSKVEEELEKVKLQLNADTSLNLTNDFDQSEGGHLKKLIAETEKSIQKQKNTIDQSSKAIEEAEKKINVERCKLQDAQCAKEELEMQLNIWKQELEMMK